MTRLLGILAVLLVVVAAMAFAAANAGQEVTLNLGFLILYRVPVTLVAFGGLLLGMLAMFATGIHTDLKVRKILRDRLAEEARTEQRTRDVNQRDLFESPLREGADAAPVDRPPPPPTDPVALGAAPPLPPDPPPPEGRKSSTDAVPSEAREPLSPDFDPPQAPLSETPTPGPPENPPPSRDTPGPGQDDPSDPPEGEEPSQ